MSKDISTNYNYVKFFESIWSQNKARGLAAQVSFEKEFTNGIFKKHGQKLFNGCWLLSPKSPDHHKTRFSIFVHPYLMDNMKSEYDPFKLLQDKGRPFFAIAEYLKNAGIAMAYVLASSNKFSFDHIFEKNFLSVEWNIFFYEKEKLIKKHIGEFFDLWHGKGRPSFRRIGWEDRNIERTFLDMDGKKLESMFLNELFYTGYLKSVIKKPVNDPYDVDGFIVSLSQKHIFPIEIKEKFPVLTESQRFFGIDAGRIMMLLRLCIPNDSNSIYIVREVREGGREFVSWKFITLSKILMSAGWNLQAGGLGMGGQSTQTIRLPYDEFEILEEKTFEEENLKKISNLPEEVKNIAAGYMMELEKRFF